MSGTNWEISQDSVPPSLQLAVSNSIDIQSHSRDARMCEQAIIATGDKTWVYFTNSMLCTRAAVLLHSCTDLWFAFCVCLYLECRLHVLQCIVVYCSVLQCIAAWRFCLACVAACAACRSALQCIAVCCNIALLSSSSVLQCVAVRYSFRQQPCSCLCLQAALRTPVLPEHQAPHEAVSAVPVCVWKLHFNVSVHTLVCKYTYYMCIWNIIYVCKHIYMIYVNSYIIYVFFTNIYKYVRMYILMYDIYAYIYIHIYIHITHTYIYADHFLDLRGPNASAATVRRTRNIHVCGVCMCVYVCVYIYAYKCRCIRMYIYVYV